MIGVIMPKDIIMIRIKTDAGKVPVRYSRPPMGRMPISVAGRATWKILEEVIQLRIQPIKQSAPSLAARTNLLYELLTLPKALMTWTPLMYSTAMSLSALVFTMVLLYFSSYPDIMVTYATAPTGIVARLASPIRQSRVKI